MSDSGLTSSVQRYVNRILLISERLLEWFFMVKNLDNQKDRREFTVQDEGMVEWTLSQKQDIIEEFESFLSHNRNIWYIRGVRRIYLWLNIYFELDEYEHDNLMLHNNYQVLLNQSVRVHPSNSNSNTRIIKFLAALSRFISKIFMNLIGRYTGLERPPSPLSPVSMPMISFHITQNKIRGPS